MTPSAFPPLPTSPEEAHEAARAAEQHLHDLRELEGRLERQVNEVQDGVPSDAASLPTQNPGGGRVVLPPGHSLRGTLQDLMRAMTEANTAMKVRRPSPGAKERAKQATERYKVRHALLDRLTKSLEATEAKIPAAERQAIESALIARLVTASAKIEGAIAERDAAQEALTAFREAA